MLYYVHRNYRPVKYILLANLFYRDKKIGDNMWTTDLDLKSKIDEMISRIWRPLLRKAKNIEIVYDESSQTIPRDVFAISSKNELETDLVLRQVMAYFDNIQQLPLVFYKTTVGDLLMFWKVSNNKSVFLKNDIMKAIAHSNLNHDQFNFRDHTSDVIRIINDDHEPLTRYRQIWSRLTKDFAGLLLDCDALGGDVLSVRICPGQDISQLVLWEVKIAGPSGSPYDGGLFTVNLRFRRSYPIHPPIVTITTPIYHMNVREGGRMDLRILDDEWSDHNSPSDILTEVFHVLSEPYVNRDLTQPELNKLYRENKDMYINNAKESTRKHAMKQANTA